MRLQNISILFGFDVSLFWNFQKHWKNSSKYLLLCFTEERNAYTLGQTWRWVNDQNSAFTKIDSHNEFCWQQYRYSIFIRFVLEFCAGMYDLRVRLTTAMPLHAFISCFYAHMNIIQKEQGSYENNSWDTVMSFITPLSLSQHNDKFPRLTSLSRRACVVGLYNCAVNHSSTTLCAYSAVCRLINKMGVHYCSSWLENGNG